jgi:hypothetical protein
MDNDSKKNQWPSVATRCAVSEHEYYETLIEGVTGRARNGQVQKIRIFHSIDNGKKRVEIPLKMTWRGWYEHIFKYVGGDMWPPRGEDVENFSVKNGRLTFRFATIFQPNRDGTVTSWEAEYWPEVQKWKVHFFKYF